MIIIFRKGVGTRSVPTPSSPIQLDFSVKIIRSRGAHFMVKKVGLLQSTDRLAMDLILFFESHFKQSLTNTQVQTLKMLVWLLTVQKTVKIERLAACSPLPIKYQSRRRHIQRFLRLFSLSLPIFWFPIIQAIINQEFSLGSQLILTLDRTQWKSHNIFVIAVIYKKRALPIYWQVLQKKGSTNFLEQKALIKPVLRLLKKYQLVIIGDREFHGVQLSHWLKTRAKTQKINFIFRQKQDTNYRKPGQKYQPLSNLAVAPGTKIFLSNINITNKKGFGSFNLVAYWKRKYRKKMEKEPWYLLTNLESLDEVLKIYRSRMGIEAMFKDCKTGGYNLEGSQANPQRLTNLILLIAIAYTSSCYRGKIFKQTGYQNYICRLQEAERKERRHSNFWVGMYGELWLLAWDYLVDIVQAIMNFNPQKKLNYQRGLKVISKLQIV